MNYVSNPGFQGFLAPFGLGIFYKIKKIGIDLKLAQNKSKIGPKSLRK